MTQEVWPLELQKPKPIEFKGTVIGVPKVQKPESSCTICMVGKQPRLSFKSSLPMRANEGLHAVHSKNFGPLEVPSYGGNKNFITFVDGFSRMLWIFQIKSKNEGL